jgi:hypothetical protein
MMMTVDNVYNYKNKNAFWVPDQTPQSAVGQNRNKVLPVLPVVYGVLFATPNPSVALANEEYYHQLIL